MYGCLCSFWFLREPDAPPAPSYARPDIMGLENIQWPDWMVMGRSGIKSGSTTMTTAISLPSLGMWRSARTAVASGSGVRTWRTLRMRQPP